MASASEQSLNSTQPEEKKPSKNPLWYIPFFEQDPDGNTFLHYRMDPVFSDLEFTRNLINVTEPTSLLNLPNNDGRTVLHLAVINEQKDFIRDLLIAGANPIAKDNDGNVPLHYACEGGNIDIVLLLLQPYDITELANMTNKHTKLYKFAESLNEQNHEGKTPMELAASSNHTEVVRVLSKLLETKILFESEV